MGMMRIRRGEVYVAQFAAFPHEKEAPGKERPVVIVQNDEDNQNQAYPLVIVVPVSMQKVDRIYKVVGPRSSFGSLFAREGHVSGQESVRAAKSCRCRSSQS